MAKLTLTDLSSLANDTSAVTKINANNAAIEAALELTLTRTGTSPNTMSADFDMNTHDILNAGDIECDDLTVGGESVSDIVESASDDAAAAAISAAAALSSQNSAASSATTATTQAAAAADYAADALASEAAAENALFDIEDIVATVSFRWNFDSTTSMADPGSADLRFNNATVASVTALAISANAADSGNPDVSDFVATWDDSTNLLNRGTVTIRSFESPSTFAVFTVNSTLTDNTTWLQIPVAFVASNGTFANTDELTVQFTRTGNQGNGDMTAANNLSDVVSVSTSRTNLGLGTGDSPQFTAVNIGNATDTTVTRSGAGDLAIEGNAIYRAGGTDVAIADGGTGASTAAAAFTALKQAATTSATGVVEQSVSGENTAGTSDTVFPSVAGVKEMIDTFAPNNIPQDSQSTAYTTVLADANKHLLHPTADNNARTFTIAANASVAYPIGTAITFVNQINTMTIAINSDTLTLAGAGSTGSRTLAANGIATALKISSTGWVISGVGLT